jgi:hypothetical protein
MTEIGLFSTNLSNTAPSIGGLLDDETEEGLSYIISPHLYTTDLYTYGYQFKPWQGKPIATAPEILHYLAETIEEYGLAERIRYGHRVRRVGWSSPDASWTVQAAYQGETRWFTDTVVKPPGLASPCTMQ